MMRRTTRASVTLGLLWASSLVLSAGCKDDPDPTTPKPVTCDSTAPTVWVAGTWNITGVGKRRLCQDKSENVAFSLSTAVGLHVAASANSRGKNANGDGGADGGTPDAIEGDAKPGTDGAPPDGAPREADGAPREAGGPSDAGKDTLGADAGPGRPTAFDLTLTKGATGFALTGSVRGDCVQFSTEDQTDEGPVSYAFQGKATSGGSITGTFTGDSPGGCVASGNFSVAISLDIDPYPPIKPPPRKDAGVRDTGVRDRGPDTTCTPLACIAGFHCGEIDDGCGGTSSCGDCTSGTCGGGGTSSVCGCPATAQAGPASPAAGVNDKRSGVAAWNNPGAITAADASGSSTSGAATATLYKSQANTNFLLATGFGLAVPSTARITGLQVEVRRRSLQGAGDIVDDRISLVANDSVTPFNHAKAAPWTDQWTYASYGGPADLWGRPWTPAEVNSPDFGVAFAARYVGSAGNDRPWVDHIRVTVHHAESCP